MNNNELKNEIETNMNRYFKAKDNFNLLTEDNKMLVNRVETTLATLPENSAIKKIVDNKIDEYSEHTKNLGDTKNLNIAYDLKQETALVRVRKNNPPESSRAAFINVAILLYGVLNIGFILAIALMK